jgi:hypothetical protein
MPSRRLIAQNKNYNFRKLSVSQTEHSDAMGKNFDELKQELFVLNDRKRMFNLTWHQVIAVMVFSCSIVVLILLQA